MLYSSQAPLPQSKANELHAYCRQVRARMRSRAKQRGNVACIVAAKVLDNHVTSLIWRPDLQYDDWDLARSSVIPLELEDPRCLHHT